MNRVIILEGPDGGGKTTLGAQIALALGVGITNHGSYKGEQQIWKHYFDSLLPAYSGKRDVILDRCWLAEPIYGQVFRGGHNRLEEWQKKILQYVASQCQTSVVWCLPGVERCVATFRSRREVEMLDSEAQLRQVYTLYDEAVGGCAFKCREFVYDYNKSTPKELIANAT